MATHRTRSLADWSGLVSLHSVGHAGGLSAVFPKGAAPLNLRLSRHPSSNHDSNP